VARTLIVLAMALLFLWLVRRRLVLIDLSFPWFVALFVLGFAYNNPFIDNYLTKILMVSYPIYAVIFLTLFILFGLITIVLIMLTRDHRRQIELLRALARLELSSQEARSPASAR
jgi:energy-coupling factor transporter transmembrane protein EcfT